MSGEPCAEKDVPACDCESMGGRFGSHRPECPRQVAFEAQVAADKDAPPTSLAKRREDRAARPAPGEPAITFGMDDDRIAFRDQAALDEYVSGALAEKLAQAWDEGRIAGRSSESIFGGLDEETNPYVLPPAKHEPAGDPDACDRGPCLLWTDHDGPCEPRVLPPEVTQP